MPASFIIVRGIWALNLAATALVIWRLFSLGLHKTYRFFFLSMALGLARSLALFPFSVRGGSTYYLIWIWTQPILWLSYVLVVSELYNLVLRRYPGIRSLSRFFFFAAVSAATILSALTVLVTTTSSPPGNQTIYYYSLMERGVVTSLAIFLVLLLLLVGWFAVPLSRNLLTHCLVYSIYFFANNVVFLYRQTGGRRAAYAGDLAKLSVGLACLMCWVFFLSRRGEDRTASLHLGRNVLQEKRLLGQLESLNTTLVRTARK